MAKRSMANASITFTATANTTNLVDNTYLGVVQGGSSTQRINIIEVYLGGQSTASAPMYALLARDSTVGATATGGNHTDAALDAATAALAAPPVVGSGFTTKPQRSSTLHLLNLTFNAFGGIVRWVAAPGEEITTVGNTASLGEVSLSAITTAGIAGGHIVYEPF